MAQGKIKITLSQEILAEYQRVSEELSKQFPRIDIQQILDLLTIHSEIVDTQGFRQNIE
jgi:predicted nucleic acid-binding protein